MASKYCEIPVSGGNVAIVDTRDAERVSRLNWFRQKRGHTVYAIANAKTPEGKHTTLHMHRLIMGLKKGDPHVDHINGNGLDNRRENLRLCRGGENQRNQRHLSTNNTSGIKGVSWSNSHSRWRAQIGYDGTRKHIGWFATKEDAAKAYAETARKLYKEFAHPIQNTTGGGDGA